MSSSNWSTAVGNPLRFDTSHNDAPGIAGAEVIGTRLARSEVQTLKVSNATTGTRAVLYESWDEPGVMNYIWFAFGGTGAGVEFNKWAPSYTINIFVDDVSTPVVSNMNLRDFFNGFGLGNGYWTPKVGVSKADDIAGYDGFGVYRYLHAPYKQYLRVEIVSAAETNDVSMWAHVGVKRLSDQYAGIRKLFRIDSSSSVDVPLFSNATVSRSSGKGLIESAFYGYNLTTNNAGDDNPLEGNAEFFERYAQSRGNWITTGAEDFANAAFGSALYEQEVGAASAGTAHTHAVTSRWSYPAGFVDNGSGNAWLYRYFDDDPLYYYDGFKFRFNLGQVGQYVTSVDTANFDRFSLSASVSHWSTETNSGVIPQFDSVYYNSDSDSFASLTSFAGTQSVSNGVLSSSATGGHGVGVQLPSGVAANQTAYWAEITGRIVSNSGGSGTQLYVAAGGPSNGNIIGTNACELFWDSTAPEQDVYVNARSGNSVLSSVMVSRGDDLIGATAETVKLAIYLDSVTNATRTFTYYYQRQGDTFWQPLCSGRTNGVSNQRWLTIGGYNSSVQITNLTVRTVKMVSI